MISDARASCGDGVNTTEWGMFFLKQKKKTIFWSIGFQLRWQRRKDPALEEVAEEAEKIVVIDWDCRVPRKRFKRMLGGRDAWYSGSIRSAQYNNNIIRTRAARLRWKEISNSLNWEVDFEKENAGRRAFYQSVSGRCGRERTSLRLWISKETRSMIGQVESPHKGLRVADRNRRPSGPEYAVWESEILCTNPFASGLQLHVQSAPKVFTCMYVRIHATQLDLQPSLLPFRFPTGWKEAIAASI